MAFALDNFDAGVELVRHDVPVMQKRVLFKPDVHEGGFEAVFEVADAALKDTAHEAFLGGAFNVELFELVVFGHGHARFEHFGVDDHFLVDLLFRPDEALDLFDEVGRDVADRFNEPFRLFRDFHRFEFFFGLLRNDGGGSVIAG